MLMNQFKKVNLYTLGCKLNFSETSTIARSFEEAGYTRVEFENTPDVYIINTCSVTENADKKCKQLVKKAKKINADALESYRESVKEADSLVDDFFIHTVPPNRTDYN